MQGSISMTNFMQRAAAPHNLIRDKFKKERENSDSLYLVPANQAPWTVKDLFKVSKYKIIASIYNSSMSSLK